MSSEDQVNMPEPFNKMFEEFQKLQKQVANHPNNQHKPPNYSEQCKKWALRERWTADEAANLFCHCGPRRQAGLQGHEKLDRAVGDMRDILSRAQLTAYGKKKDQYSARELMRWAETHGIRVPAELIEAMQPTPAAADSNATPKNSEIDRQLCQAIAKTLWDETPELTIAALIDHNAILRHGNGRHYTPKTLRKWINVVDPRPPENKRGRPKKNKDRD